MTMKTQKSGGSSASSKSSNAPTKHQLKSEATRTALLEAAEHIFARDGYDRAQIDEIAKKSGRTRGAVYAQFKTKEQLFFALQEQRITMAGAKVNQALAKHPDTAQGRLAALRDFYADLHDANTAVLDLELKLYAMRTPESREDWKQQYSRMFDADPSMFAETFGISERSGRSHISSRILALTALKSALVVAMRFMPEKLSQKETKLLLKEIFDGLFPAIEISARPLRALPQLKAK